MNPMRDRDLYDEVELLSQTLAVEAATLSEQLDEVREFAQHVAPPDLARMCADLETAGVLARGVGRHLLAALHQPKLDDSPPEDAASEGEGEDEDFVPPKPSALEAELRALGRIR